MSRVLVVVDMQRIFADPAGGWATPGFAAVLPAVARLVQRFSPRVVFTRFVAPGEPAGAWVPYYEQWPAMLQPPAAPLWDLELDPGGHPVVDATTFGKWPAVRAAVGDATGLVLAGVSTDCCVISTALAAADAGLAVEVVADACAGADDGTHRKALAVMSLYAPLITVTTEAAL